MCGIAGIVSYDENTNILQVVKSISKILQHRGNDDDGVVLFDEENIYCSKIQHSIEFTNSHLNYLSLKSFEKIPVKKFSIALIHRRLSIIDLSEYGHQPMCDESGLVWITYNGEIYNYLELKQSLIKKGLCFFSNTDTEVVLKAYLYFGKSFVQYLNGMWAFCIYDKRKNELFLSRDKIGVKPLYYHHSKNLFVFASEQKAFHQSGLIPFSINTNAISQYLIHNVLDHTEEGLIQGIREVLPGENIFVNIANLEIKKEKHFHLSELLNVSKTHLDEQKIVHQTKKLVDNSIHQHLRSDVDVAVSLSGGIDSSIIAVSTSKYLNRPIHCFSVVFPENPDIDESIFIRSLRLQIPMIQHLITPSIDGFFNDIDELLYSQDIPIWSTSTYNQFLLMRHVKDTGIKVILSGQGSDELFAGYQHHYVAYWFSLLKHFDLKELLRHLKQSSAYLSNAYILLLKAIIKQWYFPQKFIIKRYLSSDIIKQDILSRPHKINDTLNEELICDLSYRRLKAFLKCEDRASMWHGVESRLPFSDDNDLLQWAFQIPENMKLKNGISKYVLREAFKDDLPSLIYQRKDKIGFEAPLKEWMLLKEEMILSEIKDGWNDLINIPEWKKISTLKNKSNNELKLIFKLYLFNRWKKIMDRKITISNQ